MLRDCAEPNCRICLSDFVCVGNGECLEVDMQNGNLVKNKWVEDWIRHRCDHKCELRKCLRCDNLAISPHLHIEKYASPFCYECHGILFNIDFYTRRKLKNHDNYNQEGCPCYKCIIIYNELYNDGTIAE